MIFDQQKLKEWSVVDYGYTTEDTPVSLAEYNLWVEEKNHLPLTYLEGERQQKRQSLKEHWPLFESAVVFLFSYHEAHMGLQQFYQKENDWNGLKIASYTLGFEGQDYHHLIKERLIEIGESLKITYPDLDYKLTLDTHPVLERDLAMRAGVGWFGKNSMLINRHHGSFFIIGSLLLSQKLPLIEQSTETDHCGQCTRCIDACPTKAIDPVSRKIIANDCISTFTIEQFKLDTIASEKMTLQDGFIFGCDICQDVCPWNKRVDRKKADENFSFNILSQKKILDFFLRQDIKKLESELTSMSEGAFRRMLPNTSFERSGRRGLLKNIRFFLKELNIFS